ncbi:MAG: DNA helicase II / ATP-dependent DNA helicase PcrA [Puniceicoccaceae bacterium 5H]|nr:MAG: DNA helicase II / ATP-dependent DNA helicase PcrA [Puniceicoccaceae bacterium 5H]
MDDWDFSPIDYRAELNDEQYAAVTAPGGPALVLAGAGSGKTRTLTYRVAYLLLEKGIHPGSLMLLTFTNKAAREMIDRVTELTGEHKRPYWTGTFHSIGGRLLRQHAEAVGLQTNFSILDADDADNLLKSIIKGIDSRWLRNKDNPKPRVIGDMISYARNTSMDLRALVEERLPWEDEPQIAKILEFAAAYEQAKLKQNVVDYDDLLVFTRNLLRDNDELRTRLQQRFTHLLVDEYQDTNIIQSEIVDLLAGDRHNIMAVGDDAQCIYTWRGANFENIRDFPERHPNTEIYKIVRNYRSTPEILELANSVLRAQPAAAGYEKELVSAREPGLLPFLVPAIDTKMQAQFIIKRIEGLYDEGLKLGDIAILYRSHFQALDLQLEFSRRGIPFVITSGVRFFEQAHIRDFVTQLRVVSNPTDEQAWERLLGLLEKVGPATVRKILVAAQKVVDAAAKENLAQEGSLFEKTSARQSESLIQALGDETVLAKVPAPAREAFESMVTTLRELEAAMHRPTQATKPAEIIELAIQGWYVDYMRNLYTNYREREDDLQGLVEFAARFDTMEDLLSQLVLLNSETSNRGVELSDDTVRMTTVHQAKGLEFPAVFVIGLAEEQFPSRRTIETGDMEEERRLFYVAVTRAKDELYLCYPMINAGRGGGAMRLEPSRFLRELPENLYEKLNARNVAPRY